MPQAQPDRGGASGLECGRFVAFAFAAADLLVETSADGRILFADGAFRAHLGRDPETLTGRQAAEIVAPEDRDAFAAAIALLGARGRLRPTALHLADAARTPFAVSGLLRSAAAIAREGNEAPRHCLAFSPVPAPLGIPAAPGGAVVGPAAIVEAAAFARAAEAHLRGAAQAPPPAAADAPRMGLIEVVRRDGTPLPPGQTALRARLDAEVARHARSATLLAGNLAPGRYGVLAPNEGSAGGDGDVTSGFVRALRQALAAEPLAIAARELSIAAGTMPPTQAVRALRHALLAFARGGARGIDAAGLAEPGRGGAEGGMAAGLAGIVTGMTRRAGALRQAIAERRFRLEYQAIVRLDDRRTHHVEALLRPIPGGGLPPDVTESAASFVTLAEAVGLSAELDLGVVAMAASAMRAASAGAEAPRVAVNLSGLSIQDPDFRIGLLALVDNTPGLAGRLMVELTETAEISREAEAAATLEALRARGVPVCLDDFGAGAAAFRYLKAFGVDFVKLDGAYVHAAARGSPRDRDLLGAMVEAAAAVGARAIAERIETEEDAALMRALGVQLGQGWLFGQPSPVPVPGHRPVVAAARRRGLMPEQWG